MIFQISAVVLMLIDYKQTIRLLKISVDAEANPIIRWIFILFGFTGVRIFKIAIAIVPLIAGPIAGFFLTLVYGWVVYHNYTGLRDYEARNRIH